MFTFKLSCLIIVLMLFAATSFAGQLTILTETSPPGSFIDESGDLQGLSVDIVREIMKHLNVKEPIKVLPWARAYRMALKNPDTMLFSTTRTAQREKLFKWVGPLIKLEWVFLARKRDKISINSLEDAKSVNLIGTYRDDARKQYLTSLGFTNLYTVDEMPILIRMLDKNRVDLVATAKIAYNKCCHHETVPMNRFKIVYTFKKAELYMAFSKMTNDSIVQEWQKIYDELIKSGFIDAVNDKWLK